MSLTNKSGDEEMDGPSNSSKKRKIETEIDYTSDDVESDDSSKDTIKRVLCSEPLIECKDEQIDSPKDRFGLNPSFLKLIGVRAPIDNWVNVSNFRCDKSELRDVLELAGHVLVCTVTTFREKHAKVMYSHPLEAVQAVSLLNGQSFYGQKLQVSMIKCPLDTVLLPKGLSTIGPGLGIAGKPLRNVAKEYKKFLKNNSDVEIDSVLFCDDENFDYKAYLNFDTNSQNENGDDNKHRNFKVQNIEKIDDVDIEESTEKLEMNPNNIPISKSPNSFKESEKRAGSPKFQRTNLYRSFSSEREFHNDSRPIQFNPNLKSCTTIPMQEAAPLMLPHDPPSMPPNAPRFMPPNAPELMPPNAPRFMPPNAPELMPPNAPKFMPPNAPQFMPPNAPRLMLPNAPNIRPPGGNIPPNVNENLLSSNLVAPPFARPINPINSMANNMIPPKMAPNIPPYRFPNNMSEALPNRPPPTGNPNFPMNSVIHRPPRPLVGMGPQAQPYGMPNTMPNGPRQIIAQPMPNLPPPGVTGAMPQSFKLHFQNLPPSSSFALLSERMSQFGQVLSLQLTTPGCAVALFAQRAHAEACFHFFHGRSIEGHVVEVRRE